MRPQTADSSGERVKPWNSTRPERLAPAMALAVQRCSENLVCACLTNNFAGGGLMADARFSLRYTKHTLNHWYRQAGPIFDASLAYEFYGFGGPDAREGLLSHREKRAPEFTGPTSE